MVAELILTGLAGLSYIFNNNEDDDSEEENENIESIQYNDINNQGTSNQGTSNQGTNNQGTNNQDNIFGLSGNYINPNTFLENDQQIKPQPFFSKAPNIISETNMNRHSGMTDYYISKREIEPMFEPTKNISNVFGGTEDTSGTLEHRHMFNPPLVKDISKISRVAEFPFGWVTISVSPGTILNPAR